ncbi:Clp protease [Candidatus Filomicrobium marinum]|uniref:Clp protease n=1 Tax=Candidatus Filomicrobium marinum TaxID=1608628 RepID=A0A0D6JCU3_9HYPH|nr:MULTISPECIES: Clp protease N-terminal domain-containing protein [Filomicrobium]MCV0370522.1 Clp protease [Filomicrobium sp.]CFX08332.1 Clp protease [Candidatus Filomicrobium marinum]CPR16771.1 Clp protease [Candidatus Filomicrobium marinum]
MTAPFVESLGPIPMSPTLASTLARAANYAQSQQHIEVTLEHLLLALTEDDDACIVMTSAGVNLDQLKTDVSNHVGRIENRLPTDHPGTAAISDELRRILNAAAAAASGRRNDINGGIVLAAIIGDANSSAAGLLQAHGLTFGAAIEVVKQRFGPEAETQRQQPHPTPRPAPPQPEQSNRQQSDADSFLADARSRVEHRRGGPPSPEGEAQFNAPPSPAPQPQPAPAPVKSPAPEPQPNFGAPAPGEQTPAAPPTARPSPQPAPATRDPHPQQQPPLPQQSQPGQAWTPPPSHAQPQSQPRPYRAPPPLSPDVGMRPPPPTGPFRTETDPAPNPQHRPGGARPPVPAGSPAPGPSHQQRPAPAGAQARPQTPLPSVEEVFGGPPTAELERAQTTARRQGGADRAPAPAQTSQKAAAQNRAGSAPAKKRRRARTDSVQAGQLIENIPRIMRVALPSLVEARIAKSEVKNLADGMIGEGAAYRHDVLITRAMSVRLRAPDGGFFIETSSPETQWIENALGLMADDYASWRWTVTPKARGRRRLQLIVSARTVGADGLAAETALPDQIVEIRVRTNYARTLTILFGWLAAAVAGGILARFGEELWTSISGFLKTLGGP